MSKTTRRPRETKVSSVSRREFCAFAGVGAAAFFIPRLAFGEEKQGQTPNVAATDRQRILTAADRYLREEPVTITASFSPRSAGGKHDYFSEGDYWWPDPKNPSGPYVRRDGESNPDNFVGHRRALIRLSVEMPALTAAWRLTGDRRYAAHARRHLRAWFVDPETRMNPSLTYAQAIHGVTPGMTARVRRV